VNDETDLDVLKGSEVDILSDGSLDYDDTVLRQLDVVVASVHSQFDMDEAAMTHRVCRAVKHPLVDILGHMTGRLLLERQGYDIDVGAVLQAAADHETAVEINSTPRRLDVSAETARRAKHLGVRVVINTDSHSPRSLPSVRYGVDQARRAGLQASDILNTKPLQDWPENMSF
jgi:DNA polymerase (family 10)